MAEEIKCPHCGKPVPPGTPGGLCPECMVKVGIGSEAATAPDGPRRPAPVHQAWSDNLNPTSGTGTVSYPLIAGGQIFVMVADVASSSEFGSFVALDAATGATDWQVSPNGGLVGLTYDGGQVF